MAVMAVIPSRYKCHDTGEESQKVGQRLPQKSWKSGSAYQDVMGSTVLVRYRYRYSTRIEIGTTRTGSPDRVSPDQSLYTHIIILEEYMYYLQICK